MAEEWEKLLDTNAEDAVKPPPLPKGTYRVVVEGQQAVTSSRKGTPGIEFTFGKFEPGPDVDPGQWQEYTTHKGIQGRSPTRTESFWVTPAALYRLREFCEKCGAKPDGTLKKMVADAIGTLVMVSVEQTVSAKDGETIYDNITDFAPAN